MIPTIGEPKRLQEEGNILSRGPNMSKGLAACNARKTGVDTERAVWKEMSLKTRQGRVFKLKIFDFVLETE